ncbi:MAG: helix-turn-helix transcriptional regulator [Caldilineaceae bacterium]
MPWKDLGELLEEIREECPQRLTQRKMSELIDYPDALGTYGHYATGKRRPDTETLIKIFKVFLEHGGLKSYIEKQPSKRPEIADVINSAMRLANYSSLSPEQVKKLVLESSKNKMPDERESLSASNNFAQNGSEQERGQSEIEKSVSKSSKNEIPDEQESLSGSNNPPKKNEIIRLEQKSIEIENEENSQKKTVASHRKLDIKIVIRLILVVLIVVAIVIVFRWVSSPIEEKGFRLGSAIQPVWQEDFNPLRTQWTQTGALWDDINGPSALLKENSPNSDFGNVESEVITVDTDVYPILRVSVKSVDLNASYTVQILDKQTNISHDIPSLKGISFPGEKTVNLREEMNWRGLHSFTIKFWISGEGKSVLIDFVRIEP